MVTILRQTSYNTIHLTITVYECDIIRVDTLTHALSACFISRGAISSRSGPHGRADCLAPLSASLQVPCSSAQQR